MCFGMTTSQQQTNTPDPALTAAAQQNMGYIQGLENKGFQPYTGQAVADFGPLQSSSFNQAATLGGGTGSPYAPQAAGLINNYSQSGPQSVQSSPIANWMSPYMNAYVQQSLQPQLQNLQQQFDTQNRGFDAQATGAGAFGDTGWGLGRTNLTNQQDIARTGTIANAYNSAFNTAIGAGAQDTANNLNAQTTNANLAEQALQRQLGGASALEGLGGYQQGGLNWLNTLGQQQTAQEQAKLNFPIQMWQMAQQYPLQLAALGSGAVGSMANAFPSTKTTQVPDNSGLALGGALGGSLLNAAGNAGSFGALFASDEALKEDIHEVGRTPLDIPIKVFRYKGDPTMRLGLIAQDVEEIIPEAVVTMPSGYKAVDYNLALGGAFGLGG